MQQKIRPYLSIGIDIGADFSVMAAALPNQETIGRTYKILHSSPRSVEGAAERICSLEQTYGLPVKIHMESTSIYHLPLYYRLSDAGWEVYVLNPIVTHANQNINIRNIHNDKQDARRIALLGLSPDLKTSLIIPEDEIAAVKALLREYHVMKKETSTYICRLKNQLRQVFPQYLPLFSKVSGKASLAVLTYARRCFHMLALQSVSLRKNGEPNNPVLRTYYLEKCKTKAKMTALGAIIHKLCSIVFAVLRDETPFVLISPLEHCQKYSSISQAA